jgi:type VI secretion system protein ImpM
MKVGFFGKLPGYGDFVQRNTHPALIDTWDNWLLQSLEISRQQLGDNWKEIYFNSPIWRFTLPTGTLGGTANSWISGFMMPSVDSAGRCYPFTVLCESSQAVNLFTLAAKIDAFHESGEDFALTLLDKKRPDLEEIADLLTQNYSKLALHTCADVGISTPSSSTELCRLSHQNLPSFEESNASFLSDLLTKQNIKLSIWSTASSMSIDGQKRYYQGLPPSDTYASLLAGN